MAKINIHIKDVRFANNWPIITAIFVLLLNIILQKIGFSMDFMKNLPFTIMVSIFTFDCWAVNTSIIRNEGLTIFEGYNDKVLKGETRCTVFICGLHTLFSFGLVVFCDFEKLSKINWLYPLVIVSVVFFAYAPACYIISGTRYKDTLILKVN